MIPPGANIVINCNNALYEVEECVSDCMHVYVEANATYTLGNCIIVAGALFRGFSKGLVNTGPLGPGAVLHLSSSIVKMTCEVRFILIVYISAAR